MGMRSLPPSVHREVRGGSCSRGGACTFRGHSLYTCLGWGRCGLSLSRKLCVASQVDGGSSRCVGSGDPWHIRLLARFTRTAHRRRNSSPFLLVIWQREAAALAGILLFLGGYCMITAVFRSFCRWQKEKAAFLLVQSKTACGMGFCFGWTLARVVDRPWDSPLSSVKFNVK